jgi:CHAT domain-containing protein
MPHITWCLSGLLSFLPIHAAGLYGALGQPKIFHYVVSSYVPSLTVLLSVKRRSTEDTGGARLLTVCQPATPGQNLLPGTLDEINSIQTLQSRSGQFNITRLIDREATVAAVVQYMKECNWIHLACHGVQDNISPTDSAFLLIDGRLTLKEIMKQSFSGTELAVLSACQTATGDKMLPEEAIHLAAGMLMAGYGSVVGTMWSIRDDDAPIVAEKFYTYLVNDAGGDSARAAYALHEAVAYLRNVRGEKDFAGWVPFVHLGICSPSRSI